MFLTVFMVIYLTKGYDHFTSQKQVLIYILYLISPQGWQWHRCFHKISVWMHAQVIEYRSDDVCHNFSVLDTMYRWSMMKNIHSPNWVGIGSCGPKIWPHEFLISPIEISVNWSGSKQLWTRPIYTDFNGANLVFMRPYLGPPWTNSCQIWCVRGFHHVLLKYCHEKCWNAKKKIWWCHTSVLYGAFVTCRGFA